MSLRKAKSGCVPIKVTKKGNVKVMLVSSSKSGKNWVLPKGTVEAGETAEEAAIRETREEAGVEGEIIDSLGSVYFAKKDAEIEFFVLLTTNQLKKKKWEERKARERTWNSLEETQSMVADGNAKDYVVEVVRRLGIWLRDNAASLPEGPSIAGKKAKAGASAVPADDPDWGDDNDDADAAAPSTA